MSAALVGSGWTSAGSLRRGEDLTDAAADVDLLVISTPDSSIAAVAARVEPRSETVVAHLAGSLGPDVLAPHPRRGAIHPLVSMPDPATGARRLRGAWFGIAGDPLVEQVVADLGGRKIQVADVDRPSYHAAAAIASNHLVALLAQVERVASASGAPLEAYLDLARATVDSVAELGPREALTGPAARGDLETIQAHLDALDEAERPAYRELSALARALAEAAGQPGAPRDGG